MKAHAVGWMAAVAVSLLETACTDTLPLRPATSSTAPALPDSVRWFTQSAERNAIYEETYLAAALAAKELSRDLAPNSWAVILDVDETVLDNSEYQKRIAAAGATFDPKAWDAWVQQEAAIALPGAQHFTDTILDRLHGQVVFVTNRNEAQCPATEANLHKVMIRYSRILCDRTGEGNKNPRFQEVIHGSPGTSPLQVLIWIGDNIRDFPELSQQAPGTLEAFGRRYFALPNPMYGSWQPPAAH